MEWRNNRRGKGRGQRRTGDERYRGCWTMFAWMSASFSISTSHFSLFIFVLPFSRCLSFELLSGVKEKRTEGLTALLELLWRARREWTHTHTHSLGFTFRVIQEAQTFILVDSLVLIIFYSLRHSHLFTIWLEYCTTILTVHTQHCY